MTLVLHLKIHGRWLVSPSEEFQYLKVQALDTEGITLILTSSLHPQPLEALKGNSPASSMKSS